MDTVQSPCVSKLHPFLSLGFFSFFFWLWSASLQVRPVVNCIIVLPWKLKNPHKTEQIKPLWSLTVLNVMGIPGLELGKLGICHGADPLFQLLSFGLSLPDVQPSISFLLLMRIWRWHGEIFTVRFCMWEIQAVIRNVHCSLLECDNSSGKHRIQRQK